MAAVACPHCRNLIEIVPALAGHTANCPRCKGQLQMPAVAPAAVAESRQPVPPPVQGSAVGIVGRKPSQDPLDFLTSDRQPTVRNTKPAQISGVHQPWVLGASALLLLLTVVVVAIIIALNNGHKDDLPPHSLTTQGQAVSSEPAAKRPVVVVPPRALGRDNDSKPQQIGSKSGNGIAARDQQLDPIPIQIEARSLAADFQENADSAALKWLSKHVEVQGDVKTTLPNGENNLLAIGRVPDKGPILILDGGEKRWLVRCHFDATDENKAVIAAIEAGAVVAIDGVCSGYGENAVDFEAIAADGSPPSKPIKYGFVDIEGSSSSRW